MARVSKNIIGFGTSLLCFLCIYWTHQLIFQHEQNTFIIASFGASGVLAFSEETSLHSPFKMFISSVLGAFLGVFVSQIDVNIAIKIALAISSCIFFMSLFKISYPPAGAISIIPIISNSEIQSLGYFYLIYPTLTGLLIIYSFSILKNKIKIIYYGK